jgi:ferritin-like metal-binding protein YciE
MDRNSRNYDSSINYGRSWDDRGKTFDNTRNPYGYNRNNYSYNYEYGQESQGGGLMNTIKENPLPALLIGAGLGVLIAGTMTKVRHMQDEDGQGQGWFQGRQPATPEQTMETWLHNAYGMELGLVRVLQHRLSDTQDQPLMHSKIQQHLEETQRHAERVRECIERRGGSVSKIRGGLGAISGMMSGLSTEFAQDEAVKNALADYAAEQFEVASYRSLVAAAEKVGDQHTARVCREILEEDERMADWLKEQIPDLTNKFLGHLEQQNSEMNNSTNSNTNSQNFSFNR